MKKKAIPILLAVCMIFTLAQPAGAYATVRSGSRGDDVKTLQTMLNAVQNAGLSVDGIFGSLTEAAVKRFQSANGLTVDGICGAKTWAALTSAYQNRTSSGLNSVAGCPMYYSEDGGGLCTSSATVTLLRRKQYVDGKTVTFNIGDVRVSMGADPSDIDKGIYKSLDFYATNMAVTWRDCYTRWWGVTSTYTTTPVKAADMGSTVSARKSCLVSLLKTHPEGVVLYSNSHAVVISDYTVTSGGDYQFYAYDPSVTSGGASYRTALENTWLYTKSGSVSNIFTQLRCVWYIA